MESLGRNLGIEGGNELTCALLLELLLKCGLVVWYKEQPFEMTTREHGVDAVPDFIFQWHDRRVFVAEVKSKKFLTVEVERKLEDVARVISNAGIEYLLWTDQQQLNRVVWHAVRSIYRAGISAVPREEVTSALLMVRDGPATLEELRRGGIDVAVVKNQVHCGAMHYNLLRKLDANTIISRRPDESYYLGLLGDRPDTERWWHSLPDSCS